MSLTLAASPAWPCAPAPPLGQRVDVLAEQALIVWDPGTRIEHFVRRASFDTSVPDFGFLVPTPSLPELAEAPDAVFDDLDQAIQPEVVRRTRWLPYPTVLVLIPFTVFLRSTSGVREGAGVQVLEETRVAGYDAAVLQADDAKALAGWLEGHGYASRPELQEWLQPYVARRWIITAFKVAGAARERRIATQAVRMSFASERPFFPYREPADQREDAGPPRELRVYLVAPGRMEGTIGADRAWTAQVLHAAPKEGLPALVADAVPAGAVVPGAWLIAFNDASRPRPGVDDLYFAAGAATAKVVPPPVVVDDVHLLPLPLDVIGGMVAGAVWWRRRRRRG